MTSLHDLEEVFALRLLLEPPAVRRAVTRLDAAHRRELRRMFTQMEKAAKADDEFTMFEHDRRFHRALLEACGNARLAAFVDGLAGHGAAARRLDGAGVTQPRRHRRRAPRRSWSWPRRATPRALRQAMRAHIHHTAELLIAQEAGTDGALVVDLSWTGGRAPDPLTSGMLHATVIAVLL